MTQAFWPAGFRATTDDGFPIDGGQLRHYAAGTTTPKEVFADEARNTSLGSVVNLNSAGEPVTGGNVQTMVFPGIGAYRVRLYDANNVLIWDQDGIPGAVEEEEEATTATPVTPVLSLTSSGTHTVADRGNLYNCNPTGGAFARTLPSAVTAGDGFKIGFRHNGTANQVSIIAPGSQNIRAHKLLKSYALVGMGEVAWFVSDGSDWILDSYAPPLTKDHAPYFRVLDRLTSPPASPDAGARYIINGTPTGSWNSLGFEEHDIAEADGNGSWVRLTPETGWMAFDADEEQTLQFKEGAWENLQVDPGTSTLKTMVLQDQRLSGTNGGSATVDAWTNITIQTQVENSIDGASLASNKVTLPPGKFLVEADKVFRGTLEARTRWKTANDDSFIAYSNVAKIGHDDGGSSSYERMGGVVTLKTVVELEATTDFIFQYYVKRNDGATGLGDAIGIASNPEVYATIVITSLTALQGPKGDEGDAGTPGVPGAIGPSGVTGSTAFNFNVSTSDSDPGPGDLRLNNADPALATMAYIDNLNRGGVDISAWLDTFDDLGISLGRGHLHIMAAANPQERFHIYLVTGTVVDGTGYRKVSLTHVDGDGVFAGAEEIITAFLPRGPSGSGDVSGPASSTTNAVALYSDTSGKVVKDSTLTFDGTTFAVPGHETVSGDLAVTGTFSSAAATVASLSSSGVTGGDKGAGSLNVAALYQNNVRAWTTVVKPADQTVQSNTTLFVDNALVFPMLANTSYAFRLRAFIDTGATGDFKFRHVGPSSPNLVRIRRQFIIGAGTAYTIAMDTAYSAGDVAVAGAAGMAWVEMEGIISNGANAGNFEFWWAQNNTEAVDTTVRAGSYLEYRQL